MQLVRCVGYYFEYPREFVRDDYSVALSLDRDCI